MDDAKRAELQAAIDEYDAADQALHAVHRHDAELRDTIPVLTLPDNYGALLANYRKAASRYIDALEALGFSAPVGLRESIEQS
jgi:hypothetical protein